MPIKNKNTKKTFIVTSNDAKKIEQAKKTILKQKQRSAKAELNKQKKEDNKEIDKTNKKELKRGQLNTGSMYYFVYNAKGAENGTLDVYDRNPLIIPLDIYTKTTVSGETNKYLLAVNFHWIKSKKTKSKLFDYILDRYLVKEIKLLKNQKEINVKQFKLLYNDLKNDSELKNLMVAIRLYLIDRIKNLKVVPMKLYDKLFTKETGFRARFAYKSKGYKTGKGS